MVRSGWPVHRGTLDRCPTSVLGDHRACTQLGLCTTWGTCCGIGAHGCELLCGFPEPQSGQTLIDPFLPIQWIHGGKQKMLHAGTMPVSPQSTTLITTTLVIKERQVKPVTKEGCLSEVSL